MNIRIFRSGDTGNVIALWKICNLLSPANNPLNDIRRKLLIAPNLFLVGEIDDTLVATVMGGYEGHRGWLNYLAVDPQHRRRGYAKSMVLAIEQQLKAVGCPKINLQIRTSNADAAAFYEKMGYFQDDVISLGKRLLVDEPYKS